MCKAKAPSGEEKRLSGLTVTCDGCQYEAPIGYAVGCEWVCVMGDEPNEPAKILCEFCYHGVGVEIRVTLASPLADVSSPLSSITNLNSAPQKMETRKDG